MSYIKKQANGNKLNTKYHEANHSSLTVAVLIAQHLDSGFFPLGLLLGEIVKNLSKMAVPDPKQALKMMMLSAVSEPPSPLFPLLMLS